MSRNEIDVGSFVNNPKSYDDYENVDINAIEDALQNGNLSPMERRRLQSIYQNYLLLQKNSFNEKTRFLSDEMKTTLRKRRLEEMKKEKEKALKFKKLAVYVGGALVVAGIATGVGYKVHRDSEVKKANIEAFKEDYTHVPRIYVIESGDTIDEIAQKFYVNIPAGAKEMVSFEQFKNNIIEGNHIKDPNDIVAGKQLVISTYEERTELSAQTDNQEYQCTEIAYIVQLGDTIDGIAWDIYNRLSPDIQERVTMQSIKNNIIDWNNLDNPNDIRNGKQLKIPSYQYINDLQQDASHVK